MILQPFFQKLPVKIVAVILAIALNGLFGTLNEILGLPIFMDTIFTVVVAGLWGLVPGLIVGLLSNFLFELLRNFPGYIYPFALVNMASALTTWILLRRSERIKPLQALTLVVALALVNAFLGALMVSFVFGGMTNQPVDAIVRSLLITGQSVPSSAFLGRLLVNFVDKGMAVLILLLFVKFLVRKPRINEQP